MKAKQLDRVIKLIRKINRRAHNIRLEGEYFHFPHLEEQLYNLPLDYEALLKADEFNFCHDIFGITENYDIVNNKLNNNFVPRFSIKKSCSCGSATMQDDTMCARCIAKAKEEY